MTPLWTAADAAAATGGRTTGDWQAMSLSIDSRTLERDALFVALKDQRDGHAFVADALARGAAAAMVTHRPEGVAESAPLLVVPDVLAGLRALARAARRRCRATVVAVTGSAGKTSTKEMLRLALAGNGPVHAAEKSYNNHWGVPLTLARCPADAEIAVVEIGMNHPGEIAPLAALAAPDLAVVTTVAPAHLAAFESVEGIAREKASIFSGLGPGGTAIYNSDVPTAPILAAAARDAGRPVAFGENADADVRLLEAEPEGSGLRAVIRVGDREVAVRLAVPGRHFAQNALAALAAAQAVGRDLDAAAAALAAWRPPEGRGTRQELALPGGHFALIDDAYNANPASLAAALAVLAESHCTGRRVAILGDMLELGPSEGKLHADIAALPAMQSVDLVHAAGPRMALLMSALPASKRGDWAESADALAEVAGRLVAPGDLVLVKGSLGSRLRDVVTALRGLAPTDASDTGRRGGARCSTG